MRRPIIRRIGTSSRSSSSVHIPCFAMLRIGISNAMIASRDMVDFCYHAAGTSSIFESSPFERRFRDIHTLTPQGQAHLSNFQFTGQALFGKTPTHRL